MQSKIKQNENFDENAQKEFLKGAKIAYETMQQLFCGPKWFRIY